MCHKCPTGLEQNLPDDMKSVHTRMNGCKKARKPGLNEDKQLKNCCDFLS